MKTSNKKTIKKYVFSGESLTYDSTKLHRIIALKSFKDVNKGDRGGWIEATSNLSQAGNCWVYDDAIVMDSAKVSGHSEIRGKARIWDNAKVSGCAVVKDNATVDDFAQVFGDAVIRGNARVCGHAKVSGFAALHDTSMVMDHVVVRGSCVLHGNILLKGRVSITDSRQIMHVTGLRFPLVITPQNVIGGCRVFTHSEFKKLKQEDCRCNLWLNGEFEEYKKLLDIYQNTNKILSGKG